MCLHRSLERSDNYREGLWCLRKDHNSFNYPEILWKRNICTLCAMVSLEARLYEHRHVVMAVCSYVTACRFIDVVHKVDVSTNRRYVSGTACHSHRMICLRRPPWCRCRTAYGIIHCSRVCSRTIWLRVWRWSCLGTCWAFRFFWSQHSAFLFVIMCNKVPFLNLLNTFLFSSIRGRLQWRLEWSSVVNIELLEDVEFSHFAPGLLRSVIVPPYEPLFHAVGLARWILDCQSFRGLS